MIFTETKLKGAYCIDLNLLHDERGFFARTFCKDEFDQLGLNSNIVQTNISFNKLKGTLRGMHMQVDDYAEAKLVKCNRGSVYDVIIDMRRDSSTYLKWHGMYLSAENHKMIYVPENFAHGFITMQNDTEVHYMITQFYTPGAQKAYRWDDPAFNIQWPIEPVVIAEKDKYHPLIQSGTVNA